MFVDVESAFRPGVRDAVVAHLQGLDSQACQLFGWSHSGADAARANATEAGIDGLFAGFLSKPHVLLDAYPPEHWLGVTVQDPATVGDVDEADYRKAAFPEYGRIRVCEGTDSIRKRPGMYVGTTQNARHMVYWALRDRLGHIEDVTGARTVAVRLLPGDTIEFTDDCNRYPATTRGLYKACMQLSERYELPILSALSSRFEVETWADGVLVRLETERGHVTSGPLEAEGPVGRGTRLRFSPDPQIFEETRIDPQWLAGRLQELAVLDAGSQLSLDVDGVMRRFCAPEGLGDWVRERMSDGSVVHRGVVRARSERCEVAWGWTCEDEERCRGWVNGVHTRDGGTHVEAVREVLDGEQPSGQHRLVAAVHVTMPHPRYSAPVKDRLNSPEIAPLVRLAIMAARFDGQAPSP